MSKFFRKLTWREFLDLLMIALGCAIYAFSLDLVSIPNHLADGGLSGITLIIRHFWGIDPGVSTFVLNIPLLILGYKYMSRRSFSYTIWGTICLSILLSFWSHQSIIKQLPLHHDPFLAAITAGCLSGLGLGLVFRYNGTTGGSDIIVSIIQRKYGVAPGKGMMVIEFIILFSSLSYLDLYHVLYTICTSFLMTQLMDAVSEGGNRAKATFIISPKYKEIAHEIDIQLERGFTYINAEGGYANDPHPMIYLIIEPKEIPLLKQIVKQADPHAFMSVYDVTEAIGEGFSYKRKSTLPFFKNKN